MFNHEVRTYNLSGKHIDTQKFSTADAAYKEYLDAIENLKTHLPKGYGVTVVRYNDGKIMAMETVEGAA